MTKYKYLVVILSFFSFVKIYALDDIKINDETISPLFNKDILNYNYFTNENNIKISVSKKNNEIVTGYGYFPVKDGLNEFEINVTSDNNSQMYKINVYKNYKKEDENVATFKSLSIKGHDIDFKNDIYDYYVDLTDESYLDIDYELNNLSSIVEIKNNGNFNNGTNEVIIRIKSKDGINHNEYTIHVNKTIEVFKNTVEKKELSYTEKEIAKLLIITISCILIVYVFYLLFIKKIF